MDKVIVKGVRRRVESWNKMVWERNQSIQKAVSVAGVGAD